MERGFEKYLSAFVYGGMDGAVTTFAVVAGAVGADLDSAIILILGFANLLADGFSMSVGAYLSLKSERAYHSKQKAERSFEVEKEQLVRKQEMRLMLIDKGFDGLKLDEIINAIAADKKSFKEDYEMNLKRKKPFPFAFSTYISFVTIGIIPLLIYLIDFFKPLHQNLFLWTSILTGFAFILIGYLKAFIVKTMVLKSIAETLLLGIVAACVAYFVGDWLQQLLM